MYNVMLVNVDTCIVPEDSACQAIEDIFYHNSTSLPERLYQSPCNPDTFLKIKELLMKQIPVTIQHQKFEAVGTEVLFLE